MAQEMPASEMMARAARHFIVSCMLDALGSRAIDRGRERVDGYGRRQRIDG